MLIFRENGMPVNLNSFLSPSFAFDYKQYDALNHNNS